MLTQRNAALYETGTCASKDKGARVIPSGPDILARDTDVVAPPELTRTCTPARGPRRHNAQVSVPPDASCAAALFGAPPRAPAS